MEWGDCCNPNIAHNQAVTGCLSLDMCTARHYISIPVNLGQPVAASTLPVLVHPRTPGLCRHAGRAADFRPSGTLLNPSPAGQGILSTQTLHTLAHILGFLLAQSVMASYLPICAGTLDVQQIFGRAGRPQFQQSGQGIISTQPLNTSACSTHSRLVLILGRLSQPVRASYMPKRAGMLDVQQIFGRAGRSSIPAERAGHHQHSTPQYICMLNTF